eukprot:scaffold1487_cov116-Isochrysis_galbana.AAC.28
MRQEADLSASGGGAARAGGRCIRPQCAAGQHVGARVREWVRRAGRPRHASRVACAHRWALCRVFCCGCVAR